MSEERIYTEKEQVRIRKNHDEYYGYETGSHWLLKNEKYVRYAVNNLLDHYKFTRYKKYRLDLHGEAFIAVLLAFPRYKPGLRGINSWLYTQIQFAIRKYTARKIEKTENMVVYYPDIANVSHSLFADPADLFEMLEGLKELEKEGNKIAKEMLKYNGE